MVSPEAVKEFRDIWLAEFGEDIPEKLATEEALNFLTIFNRVYRPIKQEWLEEYENEDEQIPQENQP